MKSVEIQHAESLNLDDLAKIQRTLQRHAAVRDRANIVAVGFGPKIRGGTPTAMLSARFVVRRKKKRVPEDRRIPEIAAVRLLDEQTHTYREICCPTDVAEHGRPKPVGVTARLGSARSTTAAVVRWTTQTPVPPDPDPGGMEDALWRWGMITVAHAAGSPTTAGARIDRLAACSESLREIQGTLVAVGRLPGGPDVALIETGLDRLWLSGFLARPDRPLLPVIAPADVLRWIRRGGTGYVHANRQVGRWRFEIYFPDRHVPGLGHLQHVIQYASATDDGPPAPFGPGTSGSVLVDGGVPAGLQVAALWPGFATAYAQLLLASLPWIRKSTGATALGIVRVV